ncbi:uncharacterized protein CLAFUR5_05372 [Fulvia fulva]|uniref:BTB domain-containing protein n=1 Tax=Passalora fulva TaxID=5499 RepID=A0A9Q8LGC7_PASFU|nr:uncharacterized protein CLAFUR5_05372 [Fulvia fulva]KAK4616553.1 hypothetical protein CLAFUR0_10771 [Fulvia fulva]UJO16103.1 hypothetical protein CLAFUR5_05372 [Fulvia fulva]
MTSGEICLGYFWVYTGELHPVSAVDEPEIHPEPAHQGPRARLVSDLVEERVVPRWNDVDLVTIYAMAAKYEISALMDAAVSELWLQSRTIRATTTAAGIKVAYASCANTPLTRFLELEAVGWLILCEENVPQDTSAFDARYISGILHHYIKYGSSHQSIMRRDQNFLCAGHTSPCVGRVACKKLWRDVAIPRKFDRSIAPLLTDIGIIIVGPDRKPFAVHKALASEYSDYFRGAFQGGFEEGMNGEITLVDENPAIMAILIHWLYSKTIRGPTMDTLRGFDDLDHRQPSRVEEATSSTVWSQRGLLAHRQRRPYIYQVFQDDLIDLYIFADRRGVRGLQNDIMTNCIADREAGRPLLTADIARVRTAYANLPEGCGMLRYMVLEGSFWWTSDMGPIEDLESLPAQFLGPVMNNMMMLMSAQHYPSLGPPGVCQQLHDHSSEGARQSCRESLKSVVREAETLKRRRRE